MNDTLVVRIWRPADPAEASGQPLQGFVEHATIAERHAFRGDEELLAAIHAVLERKAPEEPA